MYKIKPSFFIYLIPSFSFSFFLLLMCCVIVSTKGLCFPGALSLWLQQESEWARVPAGGA